MKVLIKATNKVEEVNPSYALNFLIPKGLAVLATDKVLSEVAKQEAKKQAESANREERQQKLAQELNGKTVIVNTTANAEGELYGSIGKPQIKKALQVKEPVEIKLPDPIKRVGTYTLDMKVGRYKARVKVKIVAS